MTLFIYLNEWNYERLLKKTPKLKKKRRMEKPSSLTQLDRSYFWKDSVNARNTSKQVSLKEDNILKEIILLANQIKNLSESLKNNFKL